MVGDRDLARLVKARFGEALPYVNWLTMTSYVMLFHRAGLETLDMQRIPDADGAGSSQRLGQVLPGIPRGNWRERWWRIW